jgi:hypothetical protein
MTITMTRHFTSQCYDTYIIIWRCWRSDERYPSNVSRISRRGERRLKEEAMGSALIIQSSNRKYGATGIPQPPVIPGSTGSLLSSVASESLGSCPTSKRSLSTSYGLGIFQPNGFHLLAHRLLMSNRSYGKQEFGCQVVYI